MPDPTITHHASRHRYSLNEDGHEAYLEYETPRAGHWHIAHTIVPEALGGRGLGKRLVKEVMDAVIAGRGTVSSSCWFASGLIDRNETWKRYLG